MAKPILSLKNITKTYPGVVALKDVSLDIYPGEVHALLGENGAGKSTLIKAIAGAISLDGGTISFADGTPHHTIMPQHAKDYGIEVVYQEFNLINCLSVAENICFGRRFGSMVQYKKMQQEAAKVLELFQLDIDPKTPVYQLPSSMQQVVEICKAISRDAKVLIMDEPSAQLSVAEVEKMFGVVRRLRSQGVAVIYISHRMEELFEISDKVSILRDGEYVTTVDTANTNREELVNHMVGRELKEKFPQKKPPQPEVALQVKGLTGNGDSDISFEVRKGEILGFAGLVGAGRTEMARMLYGADRPESGSIIINGKPTVIHSPAAGIKSGIGFIPEDRKQQGCLLNRSIKTNVTLSCLPLISRFGFIQRKEEMRIVRQYSEKLRIKSPTLEQLVKNLSGGNQQKVVLAKTLATDCNIIIFDEPTRGIDVGAKQEIYRLITKLADEGNAIIMITSEMEELIGLSDRILVLYGGRISGELSKEQFSQNAVLKLASGM